MGCMRFSDSIVLHSLFRAILLIFKSKGDIPADSHNLEHLLWLNPYQWPLKKQVPLDHDFLCSMPCQ